MSVIIVTKSGCSYQSRDGAKNPRGEIVGTQDMIRHLDEAGHKVIYFGAHRGQIRGCSAMLQPHLDGVHTMMSSRQQEELMDQDAASLRTALHNQGWADDRPPLWIDSCGLSAAYSFIGNANGASPLQSSLRYSAPMLGSMLRLKAPRICLITDIRSYPRDGEMSCGHPELRPAALLDQRAEDTEWRMTVAHQRYLLRATPSRSWTWGYLDWLEPTGEITGEEPLIQLYGASHCHVATGFRKRWRDEAWCDLLGNNAQLLKTLGGRGVMCGEGWEHWSGYGENVAQYFRGSVDYAGVMNGLSVSAASPVIPPVEGYLTSKPVIIASRGCVPILHPSWDPVGTAIDQDHLIRSDNWRESLAICSWPLSRRQYILGELRESFRQDFSVLDRLVDDYHSGLLERDHEEWWRRYGGYRPVH